MRSARRSGFALLLAVLLLPQAGAGEDGALSSLEEAFAASVSAVDAATVVIQAAESAGQLAHSGAMIAPNGVVFSSYQAGMFRDPVTNAYYLSPAVRVRIPKQDGRGYEVVHGEVVARHKPTWTSIVVCERRGSATWARLRFGDGKSVVPGTFVLTGGLSTFEGEDALPSVHAGVVSVVGPERLYTDASGFGSMEGGPVADVDGRLVGVLSRPGSEREKMRFQGLSAVTPLKTLLAHYREEVKWKGEHASRVRQALKSRAKGGRGKSAAHALQAVLHDASTRAHPAVVSLSGTAAHWITDEFRRGEEQVERPRLNEVCSGIVVSEDGLVLTSLYNVCTPYFASVARTDAKARAVVEKQLAWYETLTVHTLGGVVWEADIVAWDAGLGVALIRAAISGPKDAALWPRPLPACPSDDLVPGRFVLAIGNPYVDPRLSPAVTWGVLSRRFPKTAIAAWAGHWLTDAGVVDANCGGAAVDLEGRLIGMPQIWSAAEHGLNSGIGFVVPWSDLALFVEQNRDAQGAAKPGR